VGGLLVTVYSCTQPPASSNNSTSSQSQLEGTDILFRIGDEEVSREEFQYVFEKNSINREEDNLRAELDEYMELYVNFKLKVLEAEDKGYPERPSFQREFGQYRDQLADTYLTDHEATDKLKEEAYSRLKEEVKASHILIQVGENAPPQDTLVAYNKIVELRNRIVDGGENFEAVAREASEDPSAANNGGSLGYFSALQMVYPFENAAFNTTVGEVSQPLRTRFGYHILSVDDRRPSAGKIQVAHIMIRATEGMPEEQLTAAKAKIDDIAERLDNGENWFELCRQFSDDVRTKSRGGVLPPFGSGEMIIEFEEAAFALENQGDISTPVQTAYGWHIIRLEERQGLKPFAEMETELEERISRDSRSQITQKAFIARLQKENQLEENQEALDQALAMADSSLLMGQWVIPAEAEQSNTELFSLGGGEQTYTLSDFLQYVSTKQGRSPYRDPAQYMQALYERYREDGLMEYEKDHLADKYEDYRYLVKEYRDGILLFQLMDETIWSKAVADTSGLKEYFENHRDQYQWEERATATILSAMNAEVLEEAIELVQEGKYPTQVIDRDVSFSGPVRMVSDNQRLILNEAITLLVNDPTATAELDVQMRGEDSLGYASVTSYFTERGIDEDRVSVRFGKSRQQNGTLILSVFSERSKAMEGFFNQEAPLALVSKEGLYEQDKEAILNEVPWEVGEHQVTWDNRSYYVWIKNIQPGAQKELSEVRGAVISDYQDYLEKEWLGDLRKKFPVTVNEEARKAVYQAYDLD